MTAIDENTDKAQQREFAIQRVYIKDKSYEAPETPYIFELPWEPQLDVHIQSRHADLKDNLYEVVLKLTITAKSQEKTAFIAEVHQAGIFLVKNFADDEKHQLLGQMCPNILYPYARSIISSMVAEGSFPGLYLAPINFEALYQQSLQQQAAAVVEGSETVN